MSAPAWIALGALILAGIQTGLRLREHLIDYPIRKPEEEETPEGE